MDITILLEEFCLYSTHIKGYTSDTIRRYRQMVRFFIKHEEINCIEEVTENMIHAFFIYGRVERNWGNNTFITYHKTLLVFFRWCVKKGYMKVNFVEHIELPKKQQTLPKRLKQQEAFRLLEVAYNLPYDYHFLRYRNHAIIAMFIYAGLRKRELVNLTLNHIDLENLTIFIHQGKGRKDRVIPMSFTLAQILNRYLLERKRLKKTCPKFFTSLNRNQGFTISGLKRMFELIKKSSGIHFTAHKLRHTFATLMLEGGCDIFSLSKMMGHSDIKTTTIYLSATAEHLRSQVGKHPLNNT